MKEVSSGDWRSECGAEWNGVELRSGAGAGRLDYILCPASGVVAYLCGIDEHSTGPIPARRHCRR